MNKQKKMHSEILFSALSNVSQINLYNFKLHCFKVGAFFETQCILSISSLSDCLAITCVIVLFEQIIHS